MCSRFSRHEASIQGRSQRAHGTDGRSNGSRDQLSDVAVPAPIAMAFTTGVFVGNGPLVNGALVNRMGNGEGTIFAEVGMPPVGFLVARRDNLGACPSNRL